MTEQEVAVLIALLPMIILTSWAIRIMIGSDQKDQIGKSDRIPVRVREQRRKKDQ